MTRATIVMSLAALVVLEGCVYELEDSYEATVVTTLEGSGGPAMTTEATETVVFEQEDELAFENELRMVREVGGDRCAVIMKRRGGCGLRIAPGQTCDWRGGAWTTAGGGAPNDGDGDLVLALEWALDDGSSAVEVLTMRR